jgi:hypothetical protein
MPLTLLTWLNTPGTVHPGSPWGASPTTIAYALASGYLNASDEQLGELNRNFGAYLGPPVTSAQY